MSTRSNELARARASLASAGLTADEVFMLAALFFDGETQQRLAVIVGRHQANVCRAVQRAIARLKAAGLPPPARLGAGRKARPIPMDPEVMGRLCFRDDGRGYFVDDKF